MEYLMLALLVALSMVGFWLFTKVKELISLFNLIKEAENFAGYTRVGVRRNREWTKPEYYPRVLEGIRSIRRKQLMQEFDSIKERVMGLVPKIDRRFVEEFNETLEFLVDSYNGEHDDLRQIAQSRMNHLIQLLSLSVVSLAHEPLTQRQCYRFSLGLSVWIETVMYVLPAYNMRYARIKLKR